MEVLEAIKDRRSIRRFKEEPVPAEAIGELKEALVLAPSARNLQPRKFFFITDSAVRERFHSVTSQDFVGDAPLIVVACRDLSKISDPADPHFYTAIDTTLSLQNMVLAATELGLGTCYVGAFERDKVVEILDLPEHLKPLLLIPVGFPAEKPEAKPRLPVTEAVTEI